MTRDHEIECPACRARIQVRVDVPAFKDPRNRNRESSLPVHVSAVSAREESGFSVEHVEGCPKGEEKLRFTRR